MKAPPTPLRVCSYGGGVQSTALLVLAAQGKIDFPTFIMANVGDDSEHPATLRYVREIAAPYAAANGINLHVLDRTRRDGSVETLWGRLMDDRDCGPKHAGPDCERCEGTGRVQSRSLPIPVRMSNGAPGTRSCTADFKIRVTGKWLRQHGATADNPATVAIGISVDEIHRANNRRVEAHELIVYPLLDLRLRRDDCMRIISGAGIPVPPKSSCFFCPFHRETAWRDLAHDEPELFEKSCHLEDTLNERREMLGKDPVYLTRFGIPLARLITTEQDRLPDSGPGDCDSGWCMT